MSTRMVILVGSVAFCILAKVFEVLAKRWVRNRSPQPGPLLPPEAAAKRALCLTAMIARGQMETIVGMARVVAGVNLAGPRQSSARGGADPEIFNQWMRDQDLWDSLSPKERKLMAADCGKWSPRDAINASWRLEAAGVIAWSVGLLPDLPAWDVKFDEKSLPKAIGFQVPIAFTLGRLLPRPEEEIRRTRDIAERWLWRARTTQLMKEKPNTPLPPGMTFGKIIRLAAEKCGEEGLFEPIRGDFPAFGKGYHDLDDDEWSTMRSIATERLYALNWLCGCCANWDKVQCGT